MSRTINTGVKLDESLHQRLKVLGNLKARTPHFLMKAAIEEYVRREEQYEQEKEADLQRWEHYKLTGHAVSHQDVKVWLNTWGSGSTSEAEVPCPK